MCIVFFFWTKDPDKRKRQRSASRMWTAIASRISKPCLPHFAHPPTFSAQQYVRYLTLPFAIVVGVIGYNIEQHLSAPKQIPYLDHSIIEERLEREMNSDEELRDFSLVKEKQRIVPKSSLLLNTSRSFDKEN